MKFLIIVSCLVFFIADCQAANNNKIYQGSATWYQKGRKTADGKLFNPNKYSVAHRTEGKGTMLRLTNVKNGKTINAVVNDRGPFVRTKELDVSRGGAIALGFFHNGTAELLIKVLDRRK